MTARRFPRSERHELETSADLDGAITAVRVHELVTTGGRQLKLLSAWPATGLPEPD